MAADKLQEPEREALKLALEALDIAQGMLADLRSQHQPKMLNAYTTIKEALAQPAQEPDALTIAYQSGFYDGKKAARPAHEPVAWAVQGCSKMWRGEFAEIDAKAEAKRIGGTCVAYALYATPPAAQPAQEPDYWLGYGLQAHIEKPFENATALYITPPKREWAGLTDEDADDLFVETQRHMIGAGSREFTRIFTRLINAKLKEQNTWP
jgi:hypothetical protein